MKRKSLLLYALLFFMTGCKVGPNYLPPKNDLKIDFVAAEIEPEVLISDEEPPLLWWEIFNDSLLNKYIQLAATYNQDILQARMNILAARAARDVSAAPLYPQVSVDVDAFHLFLSRNGPIDALARSAGGASNQAAFIPQKFNIFNNFMDASWEIDLFGKTRRSIEAAEATIGSAQEEKNERLISVFAEIARNYIELRSAQQEKILLEQNIALLKNNVEILQKRFSTGYSNLLDLEQINIQLNQALAELPQATLSIYRSLFAISVLTGAVPEALLEELLPFQPLPNAPELLLTGLKSDLLRRRPDIRKAERDLAGATANIGVAVGSFYPTITLAGILGLESLQIRTLYKPNSKNWIYGADINMPVFQGGKLIGNLKIAERQAAALAFAYQETVLNALQETETALIAYGEDLKARDELRAVVGSNERLKNLNERRYEKGLVAKLDYLNSELILNNANLTLLQTETALLLDLISFYKALGGGWEAFCFTKCKLEK